MVRVKNRWLLIEILYPDNVVPPVTGLTESTPVVLSNSPSPLLGSKQVSGSKQAGPHRTKSQSNSQSQLQSQSQSQLQRHHARDPALLLQYHKPTDDRLTPQVLLRTIRDNVAELFGDYGVGKISGSLAVKYLSPATSTAIVRVPRSHYRLVWAALTFGTTRLPIPATKPTNGQAGSTTTAAATTSSGSSSTGGATSSTTATATIGNPHRCVFRVVRVSGTVRKSETELIRRNKALVASLTGSSSTAAAAAAAVEAGTQGGGGDGALARFRDGPDAGSGRGRGGGAASTTTGRRPVGRREEDVDMDVDDSEFDDDDDDDDDDVY